MLTPLIFLYSAPKDKFYDIAASEADKAAEQKTVKPKSSKLSFISPIFLLSFFFVTCGGEEVS